MDNKEALWALMGRCFHLTRERISVRMDRYGVTPSQSHVLMYLHDHNGQAPQNELTAHMHVKPPTANGLIDRLCEKGMVSRSVSGTDARRKLITITEKGAAQQALFLDAFQSMESQMLNGLTDEETEQLRSLLIRMIKNLEEDRIP